MKTKNATTENRRINGRKDYRQEVFFSKGPIFCYGNCENISTGGALISNNSLLNIATGIEILIAIPLPKRHASIKRKATVRWVERDRFGLQFYRRKNSRKIYKRKVTVFTDSIIFPATITNLSKGGANIIINQKVIVENGSEIHVIIPFAKRKKELIKRSVVKWKDNDQLGVQFL